MPTEVASTEYGVIIHHDEWNTLELKWLPASKSLLENLCGLLLGCDADSAGLDGVGEDPHSSGRNLIGHGGSGIDNGGVSYSPAA
jgi:hypothetical protein